MFTPQTIIERLSAPPPRFRITKTGWRELSDADRRARWEQYRLANAAGAEIALEKIGLSVDSTLSDLFSSLCLVTFPASIAENCSSAKAPSAHSGIEEYLVLTAEKRGNKAPQRIVYEPKLYDYLSDLASCLFEEIFTTPVWTADLGTLCLEGSVHGELLYFLSTMTIGQSANTAEPLTEKDAERVVCHGILSFYKALIPLLNIFLPADGKLEIEERCGTERCGLCPDFIVTLIQKSTRTDVLVVECESRGAEVGQHALSNVVTVAESRSNGIDPGYFTTMQLIDSNLEGEKKTFSGPQVMLAKNTMAVLTGSTDNLTIAVYTSPLSSFITLYVPLNTKEHRRPRSAMRSGPFALWVGPKRQLNDPAFALSFSAGLLLQAVRPGAFVAAELFEKLTDPAALSAGAVDYLRSGGFFLPMATSSPSVRAGRTVSDANSSRKRAKRDEDEDYDEDDDEMKDDRSDASDGAEFGGGGGDRRSTPITRSSTRSRTAGRACQDAEEGVMTETLYSSVVAALTRADLIKVSTSGYPSSSIIKRVPPYPPIQRPAGAVSASPAPLKNPSELPLTSAPSSLDEVYPPSPNNECTVVQSPHAIASGSHGLLFAARAGPLNLILKEYEHFEAEGEGDVSPAVREARIYRQLASLAGRPVVPAWYGLFKDQDGCEVLLLERFGEAFKSFDGLRDDERDALFSLVETLHVVGGLHHRDLAPRNILYDPERGFRLCDLESCVRHACAGEECEALINFRKRLGMGRG